MRDDAERLVREAGYRIDLGQVGPASLVGGLRQRARCDAAIVSVIGDTLTKVEVAQLKHYLVDLNLNNTRGKMKKADKKWLLKLGSELDAGEEEEVKYPRPFNALSDAISWTDVGERRLITVYDCSHCDGITPSGLQWRVEEPVHQPPR